MWKVIYKILGFITGLTYFINRRTKLFYSALFWGSFGKVKLNEKEIVSGYDDATLAQNYLQRYYNQKITFGDRERQLLLPIFYCLNRFKEINKHSNYSFADLGGGLGLHFDVLKQYLNETDISTYKIIETSNICKIYGETPALHIDSRKNFFTIETFPFGEQVDVFLIIGSLQYMDDWNGVMEKILSSATFVILDRLPLIDGNEDVLSKQYVKPPIYDHSTSYSITYIAKSNFESKIKKLGMKVDFFHEDKISQSSLNWKYVKNYTYVISKIDLVSASIA